MFIKTVTSVAHYNYNAEWSISEFLSFCSSVLKALFPICKLVSRSGVGLSVRQSVGLSSLFNLRTLGSRFRD